MSAYSEMQLLNDTGGVVSVSRLRRLLPKALVLAIGAFYLLVIFLAMEG